MKFMFILNAVLLRDFYTNLWIPTEFKSKEHIVPKSLLLPRHKNDKSNLVITDYRLNNFRSNYRFSEISQRDLKEFPRQLSLMENTPLFDNSSIVPFYGIDFNRQLKILVACRNSKEKLFYPLMSHYKISKIIQLTLDKYKYIKLENIVEDPIIYKRWLKKI